MGRRTRARSARAKTIVLWWYLGYFGLGLRKGNSAMPFIPTAGTAEVEIRQMLFGQLIENTLYFFQEGGWTSGDLLTLAGAVSGWFVEEILPNLSEDLTLREVVARDISTATGAQVVVAASGTINGGVANPSTPSNVSIAISFRTAMSGRSFRGRNFMAGFSGNDVGDNLLSAAVADALVGAYNLLQSAVADVLPDAVWVVVSRFALGAARLAGEVTPILVATLTDYFIDSQRRRLTGRGN